MVVSTGQPFMSRAAAFDADVIVIGAGAAGLATAIFTRRAGRDLRVICLDGAKHLGAKILVSGGSRCNVTNRRIEAADFWGGSRHLVARVLRSFDSTQTIGFFVDLGVPLHEEEDGKLFPDSQRARTVLNALLHEADARSVQLRPGSRVRDIQRVPGGFVVAVDGAPSLTCARVVLATGGRSLPKTGSDGFGYELAARLGHAHIDTTPALAPLVLNGERHRALAGVSHEVSLTCGDRRARTCLTGPLLWTHFGISGPVALNISRHWHRARLEGRTATVTINLCPGESSDNVDAWLQQERDGRPRALVHTIVGTRLPAAVAAEWCRATGIGDDVRMSHLPRSQRADLVQALTATVLPVTDSRGYAYAEVTAGGVPLGEVDVSSMESRVCRGLHLVGEILDVDGRLGGFNFQWAWSSAWVAGHAMARALTESGSPSITGSS